MCSVPFWSGHGNFGRHSLSCNNTEVKTRRLLLTNHCANMCKHGQEFDFCTCDRKDAAWQGPENPWQSTQLLFSHVRLCHSYLDWTLDAFHSSSMPIRIVRAILMVLIPTCPIFSWTKMFPLKSTGPYLDPIWLCPICKVLGPCSCNMYFTWT